MVRKKKKNEQKKKTKRTSNYRLPVGSLLEQSPLFSCRTLTSIYSHFQTAERAQGPETELHSSFSQFPGERRTVLFALKLALFFLFRLPSIISGPSGAQLSSAAQSSASLAERPRAVRPCPAVRCGRALPCGTAVQYVPCCAVLRAVVVQYLLFHT